MEIEEPIIDFHVHLIPGVDDGAASMGDAIEMARLLCDNGVSTAVATPHFVSNTDCFGPEYISHVKHQYVRLVEQIKEENIPLKLLQGFEVHASEDMMYYESFDELTVDGTKYILIEVPFGGEVPWLEDFVYTLQIKKVKPIIVHPERCSCLGNNLARLQELASSGVILQLNAGSIYGLYGRTIQRIALNIIKMKEAKLIFGSDAHNTKHAKLIQEYLVCIIKLAKGVDMNRFLSLNARSLLAE